MKMREEKLITETIVEKSHAPAAGPTLPFLGCLSQVYIGMKVKVNTHAILHTHDDTPEYIICKFWCKG